MDSAKGEDIALLAADAEHLHGPHRSETLRRPGLRTVGTAVTHALAANAALRCLSGFLIFFLAFLLREHPLTGQSAACVAGHGRRRGGRGQRARYGGRRVAEAARAGADHRDGRSPWSSARRSSPRSSSAPSWSRCLAAVAGFCQALAKLSLDALIQRDVPEQVRTSAFARSETLLQMAWVVGGAIGIALPLIGELGLGVAAAIVATGWLTTVKGLVGSARHGGRRPPGRLTPSGGAEDTAYRGPDTTHRRPARRTHVTTVRRVPDSLRP